MHIWLVKIGETLPIDSCPRLYRMGMLAQALAASGHEITWWASTWDHAQSRYRFAQDTTVEVMARYHLRLLHSTVTYQRAVSRNRAWQNWQQARAFARSANRLPPPHLIVSAMPTPDLADQAVRFARAHRIPSVVDARDMWPDVISEVLSPAKRLVAWPYLAYMRRVLRHACHGATGLTSITEPFLDWIARYAGRPRTSLDRAFPLAYSEPPPPSEAELMAAREFWWQKFRMRKGDGSSVVLFLGKLNRTILAVFGDVLVAAEKLARERPDVRFVFGGDGDCANELRRRASARANIVFAGQLGIHEMAAVKEMAAVALLPVQRRADYQMSLSNKVYDYLAAGLPIVSYLRGCVGDLLDQKACGVCYDDAEGLSAALKQLHDQPEFRQKLGAASRRVFEEQFDASRVYPQFVAYLEALAAASRSPDGLF